MTTHIAFIGCGEAGQAISRGLLAEDTVRIRAYDILFDDPANEAADGQNAPNAAGAVRHLVFDTL